MLTFFSKISSLMCKFFVLVTTASSEILSSHPHVCGGKGRQDAKKWQAVREFSEHPSKEVALKLAFDGCYTGEGEMGSRSELGSSSLPRALPMDPFPQPAGMDFGTPLSSLGRGERGIPCWISMSIVVTKSCLCATLLDLNFFGGTEVSLGSQIYLCEIHCQSYVRQ